jgi:hypothetical protein
MALSFIYSLELENYLEDIQKLIKTMLTTLNRACYISLDKSGDSVYEFCKENQINLKKVFIIDMISSRFKKCKSKKDIVYLDVNDLDKNLKLIIKAIEKNKCDALILDSLSSFQIYYPEKDFLKFAHLLLVYTESQHIITNLIVQKKDIEKNWAKSLMPLVEQKKEVMFS